MGRKPTLTNEEVEQEIERLKKSEAVSLGRKKWRLEYRRRTYLSQLRYNKGVWKVTNDLLYTTGNMTPSIIAGAAAGPVAGKIVGSVVTGLSSAGNSYAQMIEKGYGSDQALKYGLLTGAAEGGLSYLLGGISAAGGKLTGKAISKAIDGIDNGIARFFVDFAINSSSEALEAGAQSILEPIFKKIATGEDFEGIDWSEVGYSAMLGALSAGLLEGVPNAYRDVHSNYRTETRLGGLSNTEAVGAFFKGNENGTKGFKGVAEAYKTGKQNVKAAATEFVGGALDIDPDNAHAQRMQARLDKGKNVSGYQINRIIDDSENTLVLQDKAKIKSAVEARLTALGETGDISGLADVIVKAQTEENLTRSEKAELESSLYGQRVLNELNHENISSGEYTSDWNGNLDTNRIGVDVYSRNAPVESTGEAEQAKAAPTTENDLIFDARRRRSFALYGGFVDKTAAPTSPEAERIPDSAETVSDSKNVVANGETVIDEVESVIDGNETVTDGESVVDAGETSAETAASPEEASEVTEKSAVTIEEAKTKYGAQAEAFVHTYQKGQDVEKYDSAYQMAYDMGRSGVSLSYVMKSSSTAYLTETQRELAYEAGQAAAGAGASEQHANIKANANGKTGRKKGTVRGDGVTIADLKKAFNDTQNTAYKILSTIAEVTGIDIVLYKSEANADKKFTAAQGKFNRSDDKISIDINAGLKHADDVETLAHYTMLRTFSHEFTHFLEKYNSVWYNDFRKTVFETLTERGEDVSDLIELKQKQNPGMDYDRASREVVAEAMTDILPDSHFIETLANQHKNIFEKLLEKLKEFLADLKAHFKGLDGGISQEAGALREQVGEAVRYVENIVKMFDEGALAAVENYQATVATDETAAITENEEKSSPSQEKHKKEVTEYAERPAESENKERTEKVHSGGNSTVESPSGGTPKENGNRSRISEDNRETNRGLRENRPSERHLHDEVDFLFDRKNDISPEKNSPLYNAQKTITEEYGMECHVIKATVWKRNNPACAGDGVIYVSEDINEDTLATLVPHETTHAMAQKGFRPYLDFIDGTSEFINLTSLDTGYLFDNISNHIGYNILNMDDKIDDETANGMVHDFYDELNAVVYGCQQGGIIDNPDFETEYGWIPGAFHDFKAYIGALSDIHEQFKAQIRAKKSESGTGATDIQEQSRSYLDSYTDEEYNHFGWARADGVLSARENAQLRSLFAETVSGQAKPPKTKSDEYMIAIGDDMDNKIAYMKGEIDSPVITRILKINNYNETELDEIRRETYALERRGIQRTAGGIFDVYTPSSGRSSNHEQGIGNPSERDHDGFRAERGGSGSKIARTKEILFDDEGNEINRTYAQDEQYQPRTDAFSNRTFSYDELVAKKDLTGTLIAKDRQVKLNDGGIVDLNRLIEEVKNHCSSIQTKSSNPTYYVEVADIGENVEITRDGIIHGIARKNKLNKHGNLAESVLINARATLDIANILANSIEVNRSSRDGNIDVPYTHVMIGVTAMENLNGTVEYYAVRSMIQERVNQNPILLESDILGKLYAVNAKKIDPSYDRDTIQDSVALTTKRQFDYSVAHLLEDVKGVFTDTFSEDVYDRLGTKREGNDFSENLQYQQRTETLTDREVLEMASNEIAVSDLSEAEKDALRIFRERLSKLKDLQEQRAKEGKLYKEQQFGSKPNRAEAEKTLNRMHVLDNQIKRTTADVLSVEEKEILQRVLRKARKIAEANQRKRDKEGLDRWRDKKQKTEMRRRIMNTVKRLNTLFKGGKNRNVKEELKDTVAVSLELAEIIFSDEIRNEDIARLGVESVTEEERALLKEYMILLMRRDGYIQEIDAVFAQETEGKVFEELAEKLEQTNKHISELDKKLSSVFERERARLNRTTTVNQLIDTLAREYRELETSDKAYIRAAYDECIYTRLVELEESFYGTVVKDMSVTQLEEIYDAYRMVAHFIQKADKAFKTEKETSVSAMAEQVMSDMSKSKKSKEKRLVTKSGKTVSSFRWNNLKPVYAFERLMSPVLTKLFGNIRAGEDVWAHDLAEANAFREEQQKKYKYKKFDFKKKWQFRSSTGEDFELNLLQIMSLYAFSKRGTRAVEHLEFGGFQYDKTTKVEKKNKLGINVTYELDDPKAYKLGNGVLGEILKVLDDMPDVKGYVDAMQSYLSDVMGRKGNEVSLVMYGVELYKEKNYFPLRTAPDYLERAREKENGDVKIKNKGFTKETKEHSHTPIVLSDFMDVWSDHVVEMSMYHAFALPLEDFYRVYNYKTGTDDSSVNTKGVIPSIEGVHSKAATDYIDQLLKDLNGGARSDPRATPFKTSISNFKKAAVMASLSVFIQQPSSIARATALVDPKYFVKKDKKIPKSKRKALWSELKEHAPVALIKEMGSFDTGMGKSSAEWLKGDKTLMDKVDDKLSFLPAWADEVTWCAIWNAVKRETAGNNPHLNTSSEEFLKLAGERFTEVIVKTQVYDSTLSKSAYMRSKEPYMAMLTAFLAEPTTSINMVEDAFRKKNKKLIARTLGAVYGSVVLNSALVSVIYAMSDDDEDETFWEKYLSRFTTEIIDGINPLTYLPFFKDIWSLLQGFDIERADMTLLDGLVDSLRQLYTVFMKDTSDMDEDERKKHSKSVTEAIFSVVDYLAALTGVPAKNIRRDIGGGINFFKTLARGEKTSAGSLGDHIRDDVKDSLPVLGWLPGESKTDKLYDAIIKGDEVYADRLKSGYADQKEIDAALRKALRENDPRIREAAEAADTGKGAVYSRIVGEMVKEGHFERRIIVGAIAAELEKIKKDNEKQQSGK